MKTRINLFVADLQPRLQVLTLPFVFTVWAILAFIMGTVYYVQSTLEAQQQQELAAVEQQKQQQDTLVKGLQEQLSGRKEDPSLVQNISQQHRDIDLKQQVLVHLAGQESFKSNGFSDVMLGLAEHHQTGLWLTRVRLDENNVSIEGAAADSASIPKWVSKLGLTRHFSGQQFSTTTFYRDAAQQLHFTLNSRSASDVAGANINEK
ncbi:MAG: Tfp pilus assembly protein PilN [Paraglaciecola sp.]|jgi:Tfp pilus assembly protein PilN